jgi:hypothetical protein
VKRSRGQLGLRQEADCGARSDQIGVFTFVVGRDQDRQGRSVRPAFRKAAHKIQATFAAKVDVDQDDVRAELLHKAHSLLGGPRCPDDVNSLLFEQTARFVSEACVVIDDEAAQSHVSPKLAGRAARTTLVQASDFRISLSFPSRAS